MFSLLNTSTFISRVKARILTLSIILAIVGANSTSLTPFSLSQDFLLSIIFGIF
jgi:hypothetical protein